MYCAKIIERDGSTQYKVFKDEDEFADLVVGYCEDNWRVSQVGNSAVILHPLEPIYED